MTNRKVAAQIKKTPLEGRSNWPDAMTLLYMDRECINVDLCKLENCEDFNTRGTLHRYYDTEHCKVCKKKNPQNSSRPNIFNTQT